MPFFSVLNWRPPCGAVSSIGRNQGSGNQEVEAGLGYCHSEGPTVEFCAAFPCNSALNNVVSGPQREQTLARGTINVPVIYMVKLLTGHLEISVSKEQQARGVAVPAGLMDPGHQEEGCFHTRGARRNVCETWVQVGTSRTCPDLTV